MDLGAKYVDNNGNVYRYVKAGGTALVPGKLQDGPADIGNHTNIAVASAAAAGVKTVTVTLGATAATANFYAGGKLVVNDVDGQGFTYTVKSHPAADASASLVVTLDDDEPIITALTTSSQVTLVPNQYGGVVIHAASEAGVPVGVAVTAVTASYYGWIQTKGIVSCLHDATPAEIGEGVSASTTTDGCVTEQVTPLSEVGVALVQGVSTEFNPIMLSLD